MGLPVSARTLRRGPRVSVLVPAYNARATLLPALDSALSQRYRSFEVIVVNDGSTDGTGEIAHRYARRIGNRVRVIDQPNRGLPAARNTAMCAARGAYFALLDADDLWLPQHLQCAMEAFEADPDLGLVHANIRRIDASGKDLGVPQRLWRREHDAYREIALRREHVACPTAVFPRAAVMAVGGFDPQFTGLGCEDRDLWLRIAERFRVRYLDEVTACYRVSPNSMSRNRPRMTAARQRLLCKLSLSPRGAPLCRELEAMLESDRGLEMLDEGRPLQALAAQLRALQRHPSTLLLWRRLLRTALAAGAQAARPARLQPA
jgi:cellulose synthase/poly-beta-1,6-N-acetylglucosamine synthase-like glycosyltransferase